MKKLLIASLMLAAACAPALAKSQYEGSLGFVNYVRTAKAVCSLTPERMKAADRVIEATIAEDKLDKLPGVDKPPSAILEFTLSQWRDEHRQSTKLLRDAETKDGVARKIVCDVFQASFELDPDHPFWVSPFSFAEQGYSKPRSASCAEGFVAEENALWCTPQ